MSEAVEAVEKWFALDPSLGSVERRSMADASGSSSLQAIELLISSPNRKLPVVSWVFVEAWWDQQIKAPTASEVWRWTNRVIPSVALWNLYAVGAGKPGVMSANQEMLPNRFVSTLLATARLLLSLALRAVAVTVLSALSVLMLVLSRTKPVETILSYYVGDSFALVEEPDKFEKMVGEVRQKVDWAATVSRKTVVIAHSQGGMIAQKAVRELSQSRVSTMVGYGSGLGPLSALLEIGGDTKKVTGGRLAAAGLILFCLTMIPAMVNVTLRFADFILGLVTLAAGVAMWVNLLPGKVMAGAIQAIGSPFSLLSQQVHILLYFALLAFAGVIALFLNPSLWISAVLQYVGTKRADLKGSLERIRQELTVNRNYRWIEVAATSDPVPTPPVFVGVADEVRQISNQSSIIKDHTTYWKNLDQFVGLLILELQLLTEVRVLPAGTASRIHRATERRDKRVGWLIRLRYFGAALFILGLAERQTSLPVWVSGSKLVSVSGWLLVMVGVLTLLGTMVLFPRINRHAMRASIRGLSKESGSSFLGVLTSPPASQTSRRLHTALYLGIAWLASGHVFNYAFRYAFALETDAVPLPSVQAFTVLWILDLIAWVALAVYVSGASRAASLLGGLLSGGTIILGYFASTSAAMELWQPVGLPICVLCCLALLLCGWSAWRQRNVIS